MEPRPNSGLRSESGLKGKKEEQRNRPPQTYQCNNIWNWTFYKTLLKISIFSQENIGMRLQIYTFASKPIFVAVCDFWNVKTCIKLTDKSCIQIYTRYGSKIITTSTLSLVHQIKYQIPNKTQFVFSVIAAQGVITQNA